MNFKADFKGRTPAVSLSGAGGGFGFCGAEVGFFGTK